jgi:hypothetical protein
MHAPTESAAALDREEPELPPERRLHRFGYYPSPVLSWATASMRSEFRRNFLGDCQPYFKSPADIHSERFNAEFDDIVAVVPHSEGWERLQRSRIHVR